MAKFTYIDLSTGHVTRKDMELLKACDPEATGMTPVFAYNYDHGAYIPVLSEHSREEVKEFGFSDSFCKVLDYAEKQGAILIRLDSDGDLEDNEDLDVHDW